MATRPLENICINFFCCAAASVFFGLAAASSAAGWPQVGCDAQHTGYTDDSPVPFEKILWIDPQSSVGIFTAFELPRRYKTEKGEYRKFLYYPLVWTADFKPEEIKHAQPVVADGRLFIGTLQGNFYALSTETGERLWHFSTDSSGIGLPIFLHAATDNGRVFFAGMNGALYALDAGDGSEIWRVQFGAPVSAAPCVAEGMIFIGDRWGEFAAVDEASGAVKWRTQLSFVIDSTAAYHDGKVFVITEDSTVYCLAAADGSERWRFKAPGGGMYRGQYPVVHNGRVMFRVSPLMGSMCGGTEFADNISWLFGWLGWEGALLEKAKALSFRLQEAKLADRNADLNQFEEIRLIADKTQQWYKAKPYNQTFYVLDVETGRQQYIAMHFHSCGYLAAGVMAPAVCKDGAVVAPIPWMGRNCMGLFDPGRNEFSDICLELGGTNGDEDHFASVGGERIFLMHWTLGGCTIEGIWNRADRTVAGFGCQGGCVGVGGVHSKLEHNVSILKPFWTPDFPLKERREYGNGGAPVISGNKIFRQERSTVFAWRGQ